jgi:orotidine-5'-phosphate decarboxylase
MKRNTHNAIRTTQLILALDVDNYQEAMRWVRRLYPRVRIFKVGLQLYTACGPGIVKDIRKIGAEVFLDLKFNDIPNTMVGAAKEALKYQIAMFTVHTLSGPAALKEVSRVCKGSKTKILGVTILTSICPHFLRDLGIKRTLAAEVLYLARMAKRCGLDGVVCSAQEAGLVREHLGRNFLIVSPGIRMQGEAKGDQHRISTPQRARALGIDYMVIGRSILKAKDPAGVVSSLL